MGKKYIKCPRCELNYIVKKDKFCEVCKQEMKAGSLSIDEFDEFFDLSFTIYKFFGHNSILNPTQIYLNLSIISIYSS